MPNWSYIPYTSLPFHLNSKEPSVDAFHSTVATAAHKRICRNVVPVAFGRLSVEKRRFLHQLLLGAMTNRHGRAAYCIVLESFGVPHLLLRNLANTLQAPKERQVYIIHLEDALQSWYARQRDQESLWETAFFMGCVGILSLSLYLAFPIRRI